MLGLKSRQSLTRLSTVASLLLIAQSSSDGGE
jgi:hypothetical protein